MRVHLNMIVKRRYNAYILFFSKRNFYIHSFEYVRTAYYQWILRFLLMVYNDILLLTWYMVDLDVNLLLHLLHLRLLLHLLHLRLLLVILQLLLEIGLSVT